MQAIIDQFVATFDPELLAKHLTLWLPQVLVATVTLVGFWLLHRVAKRALYFVTGRAHVDATAVAFLETLLRYAIGAVAMVTALGQLGVDVSGILASLGVAGLTVGFAARDALSNIISGLFIFWDRPFVIGDLVEIDGKYGRVDQITMRSTRIVTPDGRMLAVPNSAILNSTVASYTNFPHLRLDIPVSVGTGEDLGRVRQLLLAIVDGDDAYLPDRPPEVVVTALNDYNVTLELRAWLADETVHVRTRTSLRERVFETLRAAGVEMPLETLALAPVELRRVGRPPAVSSAPPRQEVGPREETVSLTAPVTGFAMNLVSKKRVIGATISAYASPGGRLESTPRLVTKTDGNGAFRFQWPIKTDVTLVFEHSFYRTMQSLTVFVPASGLTSPHDNIAFQVATKVDYDVLELLLPARPDKDACQLVVTVTAKDRTLADDPQGEPGAVVTLTPAAGPAFYAGMFRSGPLKDKTNIFPHDLTETSEDGGVFFFNIPPADEVYTVTATKDGVTFTTCRFFARPGMLVNGAPPNGPIVVS